MSEQFKKLALFSIIFIISALVIYFYMESNGGRPPAIHNAAQFSENDRANQLAEQIEQAKVKLQGDPNNINLIIQIANNYYDLGQHTEAIEYYEKSLALEPHDPAVLTDCAVMYYNSGDADKALEYLDKAIELRPKLGQAWFNKGIILMSAKNDHKQALEVWKKFIEIDPESEQAKFIKSQIDAVETGG